MLSAGHGEHLQLAQSGAAMSALSVLIDNHVTDVTNAAAFVRFAWRRFGRHQQGPAHQRTQRRRDVESRLSLQQAGSGAGSPRTRLPPGRH